MGIVIDLHVNVNKSKCYVIPRKKVSHKPALIVDGVPSEQVFSYKCLGVTISDDLSWSLHIAKTCYRAKRLLGNLYHNFMIADKKCLG